ncbi:hypothetical protein [Spirilliplanes yamanashiensis]|uniref:Luciferase-like domain-containing protein n=1 Tax=Spirilliplanes yamanashiensis TaxID=42233 RepID=A0A8J3Y6Q2_9ACTN|nr:hypothetical protein [Spirilliplanes yamanashiensis]MDP9817466.1 hypothetical protein [Spirilliplanes yamanashiensis]GIJ02881.1 hypothetical protein Sya03_22330 [Spirilliplanes yamanashiensis]
MLACGDVELHLSETGDRSGVPRQRAAQAVHRHDRHGRQGQAGGAGAATQRPGEHGVLRLVLRGPLAPPPFPTLRGERRVRLVRPVKRRRGRRRGGRPGGGQAVQVAQHRPGQRHVPGGVAGVPVEQRAEQAGFAEIQLAHIRAFRAAHPDGERARVSQGLVVIPTDSATAAQRARYAAYAAERLPRTAAPQGPGRLLFSPDLVGTSAELAERLHAHAAFREVDEVAFALPFTFDHDDYVQILTDMATRLGPALGWRPAS